MVDPEPRPAPRGSAPWQQALQGSAALRLAALGEADRHGRQPAVVTETMRALVTPENGTMLRHWPSCRVCFVTPTNTGTCCSLPVNTDSPREQLEARHTRQADTVAGESAQSLHPDNGPTTLPALRQIVPALLSSSYVSWHESAGRQFRPDDGRGGQASACAARRDR